MRTMKPFLHAARPSERSPRMTERPDPIALRFVDGFDEGDRVPLVAA